MLVVTIFNLLIVFLSFLSSFCKNRKYLTLAFFLLFIVLALRYDYGNDYLPYMEMFSDINSKDNYNEIELGWMLLNRLCSKFSFHGLIVLWSLFYVYVFYRFIVKYVPKNWYWLAVFLLVFDPYNLLVHISMLRQTMAIVLFVYSFDFLVQKKIIKYVLTILIACMFHTTALILLPVGLLMYLSVRLNKVQVTVLLLLLLFSIAFVDNVKEFVLSNLFEGAFSSYAEAYSGQEKELGQGRSVMIKCSILALCLWYQRDNDFAGRLSANLYYIGFYFIPLAVIMLMLTRLGQYFLIFGILAIPMTFEKTKNVYVKLSLMTLVLFITLFDYVGFINDPTWAEKYSSYKTFFNLAF